MTGIFLAALFGYFLGSVPFGLILTKLAGYGDIRSIGSGNIGATNVLRTGNKKLAILTLLLDGAKGAVAVFLSSSFIMSHLPNCAELNCLGDCACLAPQQYTLEQTIPLVTGFFALIGHIFPVWLKFKGGKGVATGLGVLLALSWPVGLAVAATWLLTALLFRISSLAALVALFLSPVYALALSIINGTNFSNLIWFCCASAFLIIVKHHANIRRLLKGEEPKIGKKKGA